jgi:hypothetical protein
MKRIEMLKHASRYSFRKTRNSIYHRRKNMEKLKTLALAFTLMFVLAAFAFAGETSGPPCAPGQTETMPCSSQSLNDGSTAPGQTSTPPASDAVDVIGIAEVALSVLSLF